MFIGRKSELELCSSLSAAGQAAILVVHGRRRVGKTTLVETAFKNRGLIKIEGLEAASPTEQLYSAVQQLAPYFPGVPITSWRVKTWGDYFRLLTPLLTKGTWTLFLEEYQWLSGYRASLTSELKLAWDNSLSKNPRLIVILCGSSPAFMVGNILRSKALYNRSLNELAVRPLPFSDARKMLPSQLSLRDAFDAYLLVGGIPEYLKRFSSKNSVLLQMWGELTNGFFKDEYQRIIVSSLSENPLYSKVLEHLAKVKFTTRLELAKALSVEPGGSFSNLLLDLEASGFISSYRPIDKPKNSLLSRYKIADPFLRTYFSFRRIKATAPPISRLKAHLGYAFEEYCNLNSTRIAEILGFSGVEYSAGAIFSRSLENYQQGFQIDLAFHRADRVHTLCEIKYTDSPVGVEVIRQFEKTLSLYHEKYSNTVQRVLISASGAEDGLIRKAFFDRIIALDELI